MYAYIISPTEEIVQIGNTIYLIKQNKIERSTANRKGLKQCKCCLVTTKSMEAARFAVERVK
jgi:hypothetical protein